MSQQRTLGQLWEDMALPRLAYAFKLAVGPTKVLIAFLAVVLIFAGGIAMDMCSHSVTVSPNRKVPRGLFGGDTSAYIQGTELESYLKYPGHTDWFIQANQNQCQGQGVFSTLWHFWTGRFNDTTVILFKAIFRFESPVLPNGDIASAGIVYQVWLNLKLCFYSLMWALRYHAMYSLIFLTYSFVILCTAGGAICRCAALEFASNEKPGLFEAFEFAREKFRSLISAPLIPSFFMGVFSLILIAIGLFVNIPWAGEFILAILLPVLLPIGFVLTLLLAISMAGTGLMFPAIAYEGTSGLDAIGRSICYVLTKPVWMVFYLLAQTLLGTFFYLVMRGLLFAVLWVTYHSIQLGVWRSAGAPGKLERIWAEPSLFSLLGAAAGPTNLSEQVAGVMVGLLMLVITALIAAIAVSFIFSSMTIIYAMMRRKVDQTPIEKIWTHIEPV
jgi:hypothetical protein